MLSQLPVQGAPSDVESLCSLVFVPLSLLEHLQDEALLGVFKGSNLCMGTGKGLL